MTDTITLSLTPADNTRLANLCGVMDQNLDHIARALSVRIKRRGEHFSLSGDSAALAADTLRTLYARAEHGIADNDIRLQLAHPSSPRAAPPPLSSPTAARTPSQQSYWDKITRHSITLCQGPAGTGKTHIAVACALRLLADGATRRLTLTRPVVEAGGERLGFLPGDMEQKINPYLRPLLDILHQLIGRRATEQRIAAGDIEMIPLAFMRGLTLRDTVLILDEAQNTTPAQMKMLLTRLGDNSKIIAAGDSSQSDIPAAAASGLADAARRLHGVAGIAVHHFHEQDIVRHPLAAAILKAYARD